MNFILEKGVYKSCEFIAKNFIEKVKWNICFRKAIDKTRKSFKCTLNIKDRRLEKEAFNSVFNEETARFLADSLYTISCKNSMKEIEKKLSKKIKEEVTKRCINVNFNSYINMFQNNLFFELKKMLPIKYLLFDSDLNEDKLHSLGQDLTDLKKEIDETLNAVNAKIDFDTIDDIDYYLGDSIKLNYKIGIDFFDFENATFSNTIAKFVRNDNKLFKLRCKDKYSALYATLFELKKLNYKNVIIVKNKDSWDKITDNFENNTIIINGFFNENLKNLRNYKTINILPFSVEDNCDFTLNNRSRKKTIHQLEKLGIDSDSSADIVDRCSNIYSLFFDQNFNGQSFLFDYWLKGVEDTNCIITSMLIEAWDENCSGDLKVITDLSERSYSFFKSKVLNDNLLEKPFAINATSFCDDSCYKLSSSDFTWKYFKGKLSTNNYNSFYECIKNVLSLIPSGYLKDGSISSYLIIHKDYYSNVLRKGMIKSLALIKKYDEGQCEHIENIVRNFFDNITSEEDRITYSSTLLSDFTEIYPIGVCNFLCDCFDNKKIFFKDFKMIHSGRMNNIISCLIKLCFVKETRIDSFNILFKMLCLKNGYYDEIINCVINILNAYCDTCAICLNDKYTLIKNIIEFDYDTSWDVIYKILNMGYCFNLEKDYSLKILEKKYKLVNYENKTIVKYKKMLFDFLIKKLNVIRIKKILKLIEYGTIDDDIIGELILKIKKYLNNTDDIEKQIIQYAIVCLLCEIRKYEVNNLSDAILKEFESMLSEIKFSKNEISYAYLFENNGDLKLLDPIPYNEQTKNNYLELSNEKNKLILLNLEKKFYEYNYNPYTVLRVLVETNCKNINNLLFKICFKSVESKDGFIAVSKKIIDILLPNDNAIISFSNYMFNNKYDLFFDVAKLFYSSKEKYLIYLKSIYFDDYNDAYNRMEYKLTEDEYNYYWSNAKYVCVSNGKIINKVMLLFLNKNNLDAVFNTLKLHYRYIDCKILLLVLNTLSDQQIENLSSDALIDIISRINSFYHNELDEKILNQIMTIEKKYIKDFKKFPQSLWIDKISKDPVAFFNSKDEEHSNYWIFCPGYIKSNFDENVFKQWISEFERKLGPDKKNIFYKILGKLFANLIYLDNSFIFNDFINQYIEKINADCFMLFKKSYIGRTLYLRLFDGLCTIDEGEHYYTLYEDEKLISKKLEEKSCYKMAQIYSNIATTDFKSSENERKQAQTE